MGAHRTLRSLELLRELAVAFAKARHQLRLQVFVFCFSLV